MQTQPQPATKKDTFRPEIQGLRAIAVLAVLFFHIIPFAIPGGYVGVDVFFVISGYLMTGILYYEYLTKGSISLKAFYARRIRRLLPASTLVLTVVALMIFLLPSVRWVETAKEVISSSFYLQNWRLYFNTANYWVQDSSPSILMHYWSLSIEEQYYIIWPLLFLAIISMFRFMHKYPRQIFGIIIVIICAASFIWSVYFTAQNQNQAYFSTFTRIWELALGGLLAIFLPYFRYVPKVLKALLGWSGIVLILYVCFYFNSQTAFPGYAALLPTLGAVMVIIGGEVHEQWSVRKLLSYKPFQYFGNISYSLYLWHWPVIILYGYSGFQRGVGLSLTNAAIMFCISLILAHLSKVFIEDPFRIKGGIRAKRLNPFIILTLSLAITMLAANYIWLRYYNQNQGPALTGAVSLDEKTLAALLDKPYDVSLPLYPALDEAHWDRSDLYFLKKSPLFHESDARPYDFGKQSGYTHHIMLVGDSLTAQWAPALERISESNQALRFTVYTKSACPFIVTSHVMGRSKQEREARSIWNQNVMRELEAAQPDIVIMGIKRSIDYVDVDDPEEEMQIVVDDYLATWDKLTAAGCKVLVIAETPLLDNHATECLASPGTNVIKCSTPRGRAIGDEKLLALAMSKNKNPQVFFWNLNDRICTQQECPPVQGQVLVFRDKQHLTATFVRLLAPEFAEILRTKYQIPVKL